MKSLCAIAISLSCATAFAQGTFKNLDFEQANPAGGNTTAALFPGWTVYFGSVQQSFAAYDPSVGDSQPSIYLGDDKTGGQPFQGNYYAFLQSAANGEVNYDVSLVQTGVVPSGTDSIELDAFDVNSSFVLTFDGKPVNMQPLQTFPNYTVYGGDVSEWSGQNATLDITQLAPTASSPSTLQLDNISFSPNPITVTPEPDALTLMSVGGLLFGLYRRIQLCRKK
ncbi:MAG TPA: hypothetical protein VGO67_21710 [Verrucomicrobiae bacterium]|jgi:hypothetical protein